MSKNEFYRSIVPKILPFLFQMYIQSTEIFKIMKLHGSKVKRITDVVCVYKILKYSTVTTYSYLNLTNYVHLSFSISRIVPILKIFFSLVSTNSFFSIGFKKL